jgi:hypothetical protein
MCGVSGFFTGCPLADQCAVSGQSACKMQFSASKVFDDWHEKASVRKRPRRILDADDRTLDIFPRNLVPVSSHPIMGKQYMEQISEFLCLQLYRYLHFTIDLELNVVNPSLLDLKSLAQDFQFSKPEALALHKMYVDEGYHAMFCFDMAQQVHEITGIVPEFEMRPSFMDPLAQMQAEADNPLLARLVFTAVSETLITGSLRGVARKGASPDAVSELMRDHASDEGRHHVFFKDIFSRIDRLDPFGLRQALPLIPKAILAFIEPDRKQLLAGLTQVGVKAKDAEQMVHETYPKHIVRSFARESANDLLQHIEELEIGKGTALQDELHQAGLVDP